MSEVSNKSLLLLTFSLNTMVMGSVYAINADLITDFESGAFAFLCLTLSVVAAVYLCWDSWGDDDD